MAKTSLVHRFTQVLLNSNKEASKAKVVAEEEDEEERQDSAPSSASKLTSQRRRMQLEMDVKILHERLQQETDLHFALENASTRAPGAFPTFPRNLPIHAQELLADVAMLEVAVSNLEEQMVGLELQIRHERNERLCSAACQRASPLLSKITALQQGRISQVHQLKETDLTDQRLRFPERMAEATELMERFRLPERMAEGSMESAICEDHILQGNYSQPWTSKSYQPEDVASDNSSYGLKEERAFSSTQEASILDIHMESDAEDIENGSQSSHQCATNGAARNLSHGAMIMREKNKLVTEIIKVDDEGTSSSSESCTQRTLDKLWRHPNKLSEEMVSCMRGIYCHLADPLEAGKYTVSDDVPSPSSPFEHVTSSSFSSLSDLSNMSFARSPPSEPKVMEEQGVPSSVDPYKTHDKLEWGDIGSYSSAVEVSWMSVGKEQLEYAADALRVFRSLVEQLSKVDAPSLSHNEKLAFWINIYNALMMHAYLAYGVPKNDVKWFALMHKAAYTVGGHFFNAMAIEHVLLRGKAPSFRPQIALLLALHKVKIPAGASKFAISRPEPLVMFALSCGAWSSPAVRIYTPEKVQAQLQAALHDYVRASVGIIRHGKVLVPKLLHCYARDLNLYQARGECDEGRAMVLWLSSFLPTRQANLVRESVQQRALPTSARIVVQPFNFRLRYLFLH